MNPTPHWESTGMYRMSAVLYEFHENKEMYTGVYIHETYIGTYQEIKEFQWHS